MLAPTFDNAQTLPGVLESILATGLPVVVVNDGATDATASVLSGFVDRITVLTHERNQGKAAALRTGFAWARENGYTHAATIDTDAQHDPADLPAMVALAKRQPDALILGTRETTIAGYPSANRLGRRLANLLVRIESGLKVADSQCGLRVYPLAAMKHLHVPSNRYGYETEVLTRCAWAGVQVVEAPIRCVYDIATGRVSHFRPWVDTTRAVGLHLRLMTIGVARWLNPAPAWREARINPHERGRLAAALAMGVFIGNTPLFGLHTAIAAVVAKYARLQPLAVIAGSHVSTPPIGPALIALAIATGHFVLHGTFSTSLETELHAFHAWQLFRRVAMEWTVGSLICGTVLAMATYVVTRLLLRLSAKESGSLSRCTQRERVGVRTSVETIATRSSPSP